MNMIVGGMNMKWIVKAWCLIVGTPLECGALDMETNRRVTGMVKRAFVVGIITGFLMFAAVQSKFSLF